MKKVLLAALSVVLVALIAVGGSFAYLKSEDSDVNVMLFDVNGRNEQQTILGENYQAIFL